MGGRVWKMNWYKKTYAQNSLEDFYREMAQKAKEQQKGKAYHDIGQYPEDDDHAKVIFLWTWDNGKFSYSPIVVGNQIMGYSEMYLDR